MRLLISDQLGEISLDFYSQIFHSIFTLFLVLYLLRLSCFDLQRVHPTVTFFVFNLNPPVQNSKIISHPLLRGNRSTTTGNLLVTKYNLCLFLTRPSAEPTLLLRTRTSTSVTGSSRLCRSCLLVARQAARCEHDAV